MTYTVKGTDGFEYQLQLFDGSGYAAHATGSYEATRAAFDQARGVTRRLVRVDKARPTTGRGTRYTVSCSNGYSREVVDVQRDYLAWAQARGLVRVTAFGNRPPLNRTKEADCYFSRRAQGPAKPVFLGDIHYIQADDYFTVTADTESEAA